MQVLKVYILSPWVPHFYLLWVSKSEGLHRNWLRVCTPFQGSLYPTHLHAVLEGGQGLGLVVLGESSAQAAVPFISLSTGAAEVWG